LFRYARTVFVASQILVVALALRDPQGRKVGYLGFVEADSFADARAFVEQGPFYQEQLYDRLEIFAYDLEIGEVG
jgi:uncharacterized protein YciI